MIKFKDKYLVPIRASVEVEAFTYRGAMNEAEKIKDLKKCSKIEAMDYLDRIIESIKVSFGYWVTILLSILYLAIWLQAFKYYEQIPDDSIKAIYFVSISILFLMTMGIPGRLARKIDTTERY